MCFVCVFFSLFPKFCWPDFRYIMMATCLRIIHLLTSQRSKASYKNILQWSVVYSTRNTYIHQNKNRKKSLRCITFESTGLCIYGHLFLPYQNSLQNVWACSALLMGSFKRSEKIFRYSWHKF